MNFVWIATLLLSASLCVVGCKKKEPDNAKGPMESAGEEMDQAGEKVKDESKDAVDKTGEKMEEAGEKMQDKADDKND
jgi:hypothetical protein